MTANRRARAVRASRAARQVEDGVKVTAFRSRERVLRADAAIDAAAQRTTTLLTSGLHTGLRAHLLEAGLRHRNQLEHERDELAVQAAIDRAAWDQARIRVRSLDKLVERLDHALRTRQRAAENAEWQDIVTSRAARPRSGSTPAGVTS